MNKQLPPAIAKLRDEMADKALDKLWMTPRSDESGLSLFKDGFDSGYHSRDEEVARLVEALEKIAVGTGTTSWTDQLLAGVLLARHKLETKAE